MQKAVQPDFLPEISAQALDRTSLRLPNQLQGARNLLLISWRRDQEQQLATWTAPSQALQHTRLNFKVYRMPVSAPENALYRWWDNASLRAQETDPELLHWTVPVYVDKAALHQAIGLGMDESMVVVLLVDPTGRIQWKAQGASTDATRAGLLAAAATPR
ncbi:hypothetical protein [Acidipila sp. EB88]|uniref:hypothetical protein n=1 Tax=Acidipila sp. EB88 TaxID=2305226 RepID=UPI000F94E992|nr:hypothetical protein [Acidipila sp. EB88]RRA47113.1 hypothetical protein D1Y84_01220 [Acidipila sp. EB88]